MDTLTPPRTVGGQTARLKIPDGDPGGAAPAPDPVPASRTVGGTMRLAPAPTIDPPPPDVDWDSKPAPPPVAAPRRASPLASTPLAPAPQSSTAPQKSGPPADDGERTDWLSALPVAVGLVFFAVGSMVGMTIDGRLRAAALPTQPQPPASASAVIVAGAEPPASASVAPVKTTAPAPSATPSVVAPTPPGVHPPQVPPHTTGTSPGPGGKRPPGRPGLPF